MSCKLCTQLFVSVIIQTSIPATLKTWHRKLGYPSYSNLKRFGNARGIDISNLKVS